MRTFEIRKDGVALVAFEVSNLFLTRRGAIRVIRRIPGVKVLETPWIRQDVFCRFMVEGREFGIEEPWGDSSRYWVGPAEPFEPTPQIELIQKAFLAAGFLGFSRAGG